MSEFYYRIDTLDRIEDPVIVTREIERLAQMLVDLEVGYLSLPADMNVKFYDKPFRFVGIPGAIRIYNKTKFKAVDKGNLLYLSDVDIVLQELMRNRIIMIPNYFVHKGAIDTNKGGNNNSKSMAAMNSENIVMKNKWGKYFIKGDSTKMWRINVQR